MKPLLLTLCAVLLVTLESFVAPIFWLRWTIGLVVIVWIARALFRKMSAPRKQGDLS